MNQRTLEYTCLSILLRFLMACHDPADMILDASGVVVSIKPRWAASVNAEGRLAYGIYCSVTTQNAVLTPSVTPYPAKEPFGRALWIMRDAVDGHSLWQWQDYMTDFENGYLDIPCVNQNRLIYNYGPRTHCLDLATGQTLWHKWKKDSMNSTVPVVSLGDSYFFCGTLPSKVVPGQTESAVYRGSVLAPTDEVLVVKPELPREYKEPINIPMGATSLQVFTRQTDTLLVIDYQTPTAEARKGIIRGVFGVYNLTLHSWEYKDIPLIEPGYEAAVDGLPRIFEGNVYHSVGHSLTCHELNTGELIWGKSFAGNFLFSGFLLVDNLVVANCEDGYIYGLDPATGSQRWKEKSSGSSTRLYYQNGVVYYAGGGDGLLHAVEVQTGKHLWQLLSLDTGQDSRAFYQGMVAGLTGQGGNKGLIFANTGRHIYAYPAGR